MNKHFQDLARVVGQALARRWMQRSNGGAAGNGDIAPAKPPAPPLPSPHRRLWVQQHR